MASLPCRADGLVFVSQLALVLRGQLMELSSSSSTLQPQYVTIAEDRLIALKEKQLELLGVVAATKSASEYQVRELKGLMQARLAG